MILMLNKTFEDLRLKAEAELVKIGFSIAPGAIAKLLLNIINAEIAGFYESLTVNHVQAFLSTATGDFLDAIGYLLNCRRLADEKDDDFRYRISKQILFTASANETAIRLAALSVPGIQDVVLKKFSYGSGSFTVLIITDKPVADASLVEAVRMNVDKVAGFGVKFDVTNPDLDVVKMKIQLSIKDSVSDGVAQDIRYLVRDRLKDYLTSRHIGEPLIINEITQRIMEVNSDIVSYTCTDFRINNQLTVYVNQTCRWNERYMLSADPDAIIIA